MRLSVGVFDQKDAQRAPRWPGGISGSSSGLLVGGTEISVVPGRRGRDRLEQFASAHGLHQISVEPKLADAAEFDLEVVRGKHQDRHAVVTGGLNSLRHLEAVHPRHAAVEQQQLKGSAA